MAEPPTLPVSRALQKEIRAVGKLIEEQPDNPHLYARLGHLLLRGDDIVGAEDMFREAIALDPKVPGFTIALSEALHRQGRLNEGLAIVHAWIKEGKADAHMYGRYARLLDSTGNLTGAEAAFRQAIALDPNVPNFCKGLASVLSRQGRDKESRAVLRDAERRLAAARPGRGPLAALWRLFHKSSR
jgi:predicted Zn-dependent protease